MSAWVTRACGLRLLLAMASSGALVTSIASRAVAAEPVPSTYTVVKGDTCASIAARFYGDASRVDLIHEANPGWGAPPHNLGAGQVIKLSPWPAEAAAKGPDATLSRVRNKVDVEAPEARLGKPNDPLFRGNRVATEEASAAEVTFKDETQLRLAERTLIVILGSINAAAKKLTAEDTVLVSGAVRARLSDLAGGKSSASAAVASTNAPGAAPPRAAPPAKPRVATLSTDAAKVALRGESQVSVDAQKTTRLASYQGTSAITAQNKTVDVQALFGSKAENGKAPTPPTPLPRAPRWTLARAATFITDGAASGAIEGTVATQPDAPVVTGPVATVPTGPLASPKPPAKFHVELARDAAFDDVVKDVTVPAEDPRATFRDVPPGAYFTRASAIDADAFEGPFGAPVATAVVSLTLTRVGAGRATLVVSPASVSCALADDATRASLDAPREIDATASHVLACALADGTSASREIAALTAKEPAAPRVDAPREASQDVVAAPSPPPPSAAKYRGIELDVGAGPTFVNDGLAQTGLGVRASASYGASLGPGVLSVGLGFAYENYAKQTLTGTGTVGASAASPDVTVTTLVDRALVLPILYRQGAPAARVRPFLLVRPELMFEEGSFEQRAGSAVKVTHLDARVLGVSMGVGADVALGPGAFFAEVAYRPALVIDRGAGSEPLSGVVTALGYRLLLVR